MECYEADKIAIVSANEGPQVKVSLGNAYGDLGNVDHQKELLEKALSIQDCSGISQCHPISQCLHNTGFVVRRFATRSRCVLKHARKQDNDNMRLNDRS